MRTSDKVDELAAALVAAQAELPEIADSRTVEVTHKNGGKHSYGYAELIHIQKITQPILNKHGLAVIQLPKSDGSGGALLCTRIQHKSGQFMEEDSPLCKNMPAAQDFGSLLSYMRRYGQVAGLNLKTGGDDDGARAQKAAEQERKRAQGPAPVRPKAPPLPPKNPAITDKPAPGNQLGIIWAAIKRDLKLDDTGARAFMIKHTGKKSSAELMVSDIDKLTMALAAEKKKAGSEPAPEMPDWSEGVGTTI